MGKIENWSKKGDDFWKHDKFDLSAEITKEETGEAGNNDREYVYIARAEDNEIARGQLLYHNDHTNKQEARDQLVEFLKKRPYNEARYVMEEFGAVQLVTRGMYSGYPWIEPDGRMPEEDGTGEFGAGETVQGHTSTLGELDWRILNSIDDKEIKKGYYAKHTDVHQDRYVIVGDQREEVKRFKEYMEDLDERTLDEDEHVDQLDYQMFQENAEESGVKVVRTGRRNPATIHDTPHGAVIEVEGKAYVAEEVDL